MARKTPIAKGTKASPAAQEQAAIISAVVSDGAPVEAAPLQESSPPPSGKPHRSGLANLLFFIFVFAAVLAGGLYAKQMAWQGTSWQTLTQHVPASWRSALGLSSLSSSQPVDAAPVAEEPTPEAAEASQAPWPNLFAMQPPTSENAAEATSAENNPDMGDPVVQAMAESPAATAAPEASATTEDPQPAETQATQVEIQGPSLPEATAPQTVVAAPPAASRADSWRAALVLQRAMLEGKPYYEPLWNLKQSLSPQSGARPLLGALEPQAGTGIPRYLQLQQEFGLIATPLAAALRIDASTPYWLAPLRQTAAHLLSWRRVADTADSPDAAVEAMNQAMRQGDAPGLRMAAEKIDGFIHARNNDARAVQRYLQWHESLNNWVAANAGLQDVLTALEHESQGGAP